MAGAGLAAAAAVLTKFTNAPILAIVAAVAFLKLGLPWRQRSPRHLVPVMLLLMATGIPIGCWLARNYVVLGDLTGFAAKSRCLDWTPKPIGEYWSHPIFGPRGCLLFWNALITTFWRGDNRWHGYPLAAGEMDVFYVLSSTIFLLAFLAAAVAGVRKGRLPSRSALLFCFLPFALSVAMLAFCSITVDFGTCFFPSRRWPFFSVGRLILGALVPFLIMYLSGLEWLLNWLGWSFLRLPLLMGLAGLMAIVEVAYSLDVFASQYNWFHLP